MRDLGQQHSPDSRLNKDCLFVAHWSALIYFTWLCCTLVLKVCFENRTDRRLKHLKKFHISVSRWARKSKTKSFNFSESICTAWPAVFHITSVQVFTQLADWNYLKVKDEKIKILTTADWYFREVGWWRRGTWREAEINKRKKKSFLQSQSQFMIWHISYRISVLFHISSHLLDVRHDRVGYWWLKRRAQGQNDELYKSPVVYRVS